MKEEIYQKNNNAKMKRELLKERYKSQEKTPLENLAQRLKQSKTKVGKTKPNVEDRPEKATHK